MEQCNKCLNMGVHDCKRPAGDCRFQAAKSGWVNIYYDPITDSIKVSHFFNNKEDAMEDSVHDRLRCVSIDFVPFRGA